MAFYSGKDGLVTIGTQVQKLSEWNLEVEASLFETSNFGDSGYKTYQPNVVGGKVTAKGPYDPSLNYQAMQTASVNFALKVGSTYIFTVPCIISRVRYSQDINNGAQVEISATSTGTFDPDLAS